MINGHANGHNGAPAPCAAKEILDYERKVQKLCAKVYDQTGWAPAETKTPLSELLGKDRDYLVAALRSETDSEKREQIEIELDALSQDDFFERSERNNTLLRFAAYLSQDGIEPWNVLRNLYAVFGHMGIEPFCQLTTRDKGILFGDSHGAHHWLMQRICVNVLKRKGAKAIKAPGGKGAAAKASAADSVHRAAHKHGYFNGSKRKPKKSTGTRSSEPKIHDHN